MSATPAKSSIPSNDVKTSGGIRKSLLTPCRRVGLSRVVKTPASLEKPEKHAESPLVCNTPVTSQCTPDNNTHSQKKKEVSEVKSEKKVVDSVRKPRKVVKKCLLLDEDSKSDVGNSPKRIVDSDVQVDKGKKENELVCKPEKTDSASGKSKKKVAKEPKKSKSAKKCLLAQVDDSFASSRVSPELFSNSPQNVSVEEKKAADTKSPDSFKGFCIKRKSCDVKDSQNSDEICVVEPKEKSANISYIEDDFQPISKPRKIRRISSSSDGSIKDKPILKKITMKNSSDKVKTSFKKRLSMKKSKCSDISTSFKNTDSENEFLSSPLNSQGSAQAQNSQEDAQAQKSQEVAQAQENKDIAIELIDLPLLYEETETKAPSPPDENDFYEINEEMVKAIENRIKEKENKLDGLKRAEVYLKKHKIDELNALLVKWKGGCCEALKDLLGLFRSRGDDVNMVGLLKMLNVPEKMIKYNPENDNFL